MGKSHHNSTCSLGLPQGSPWFVEDGCSCPPLFKAGQLVPKWQGRPLRADWFVRRLKPLSHGWLADRVYGPSIKVHFAM